MEYAQIDKLNQSLLKKILVSPKSFLGEQARYKRNDTTTEDHFIFGTAVDIMLTGTYEEFESKFHKVPDSDSCSDTIKAIIKDVYDALDYMACEISVEFDLTKHESIVLDHCKYQNYQGNWKDQTRVDKVIEQGSAYFDLLVKSKNKMMITETEYALARNAVMALKSDKYTKKFTDKKLDPKNLEFWDKPIIEFTFGDIEIKGELDRVIIDHHEKLIIPIDFKTTGKTVNSFPHDFWAFRYDFQAGTYRHGLFQHPKVIDLIAKGYTVDNFHYIVVEKNLTNNPMIFIVGHDVEMIGVYGGTLTNGKRLEGLEQAVERYKFAVENNAWDYPMEYYLNDGLIYLEP
jgi:hypothetical protein